MFQFYIVRLKVSDSCRRFGFLEFQFYIVRLKVQFPVDCGHLVRVSILYSSIKRKNDTRIAVLGDRVSILYSSIKSAPSRRNNSARSVSILYSSIKRISNVFMFSKNLRVSILYSSIKRSFLDESVVFKRNVSILYSSIKR